MIFSQCDGAQPSCSKCLKSRRVCHGMREACSVIYLENTYASGQKKRPRGPRSIERENRSAETTISRAPPIDLSTRAVAYYLHYHLQALDDVQDSTKFSTGVSDYFLPLWKLKADCPILDLGVSSLALALFSRTQRHPPAAFEASAKYFRLVRILRLTTLSLNGDNIDVCLLAIFFMSRYEDALHRWDPVGSKAPLATAFKSFYHHDGALAVLKFWREYLSQNHPATNVIKHTRRGMIRSALLRRKSLPDWIWDGAHFGERGLELEYDYIIIRIVNLRNRIYQPLRGDGSELTIYLEELNKQACDLDIALQEWASHFPNTWFRQSQTCQIPYHSLRGSPYGPVVYKYSNLAYNAVWSLYYSVRMLINSSRLHILIDLSHSVPDESHWEQKLECINHIETMSIDLAASIPLRIRGQTAIDNSSPASTRLSGISTETEVTKPYMASLVIWPLGIAARLGNLDVNHRSWFRSEVARLGRLIGSGNFESAEAWPEI
jgi:hypothetical protein